MRLQDKVAVITGAGSGLGRGIARRFAAEGAVVIAADLDETTAKETVELIAAEDTGSSRPHMAARVNVASAESVGELFAAIADRSLALHIAVNCAGINVKVPFLDLTEADWDRTLDVNLKGTFLVSQQAARMMEAGGSIINISSTASINPTPNTAFYGGAKAALGVISQAVAAAYHPKVRVNTIIVGPFATDVAQHWPDPPDPANPRRTRSGMRIGAPEDIVSTALYLAADASRYVNGAAIKVDGGGWSMGRVSAEADAVS